MYVLRLGDVNPNNKVSQIKKFRMATGLGLKISKTIMDTIECCGECEIDPSIGLNSEDAIKLMKEGFQVEGLLPEELFHIEY